LSITTSNVTLTYVNSIPLHLDDPRGVSYSIGVAQLNSCNNITLDIAPCVQLLTDSINIYEYSYNSDLITPIFTPGGYSFSDIAIGNTKFYTLETLVDNQNNRTGFTINEYNSTLNPLVITSGVTNTWTVPYGIYSGLDYSFGLEIKNNNTLLIGGSSIYELNISASTFNFLFDLPYPDSFVIGDFIYNIYTNRIIILAYGQNGTTYEITEVNMDGSIWTSHQFTYNFGTYNDNGTIYNKEPNALFINNNNLYIVTDYESDVYQINLLTGEPTYIKSITGMTNSRNLNNTYGMAAPNQCNNVTLIP
jgi:hypothetical protein